MKIPLIVSLICSLFVMPFNFSQESTIKENKSREANDKVKTTEVTPKLEEVKEEFSETAHTITLQGQEIKYKAYAGNLVIKDEKEMNKASFFYVAYIKEGKDPSRPITFCFNGGPGSASVWLHMGVLGPKRIDIKPLEMALPPYQVVENTSCFLDLTDLVFIDPVSTGYSRAVPGEDPKQFHGVKEDIHSVGEFIRLYTTRHQRWNSPKFLVGESYGTTRAAGLASFLHDEYALYLNGVILISSILNFQTLETDPGNDLPYVLFLPSYTAAAWYHKKLDADLSKDLNQTLQEVEQFALQDYNYALMQGDRLAKEKRQEIVAKLAKYTGLSPWLINRWDLRICQSQFSKELLRNQSEIVARFDSRYVGFDSHSCAESLTYDPSLEYVMGPFTSALNSYLQEDLKWQKDSEYKILANVFPWNYGKANNKYLNVVEDLRDVMIKNPKLQLYVASGYYDLATPYFATTYTFQHLGLPSHLRDHVTLGFYPSGHMMYTEQASLKQFRQEVSQFILKTLSK